MPGQPGNTNALKHGLYARRFTPDELRAIKKLQPLDLTGEIALLRVRIDRLTADLDGATDPARKDALVNTLIRALATLSNLAARHAFLTSKYPPMDDVTAQILADFDPYLHD